MVLYPAIDLLSAWACDPFRLAKPTRRTAKRSGGSAILRLTRRTLFQLGRRVTRLMTALDQLSDEALLAHARTAGAAAGEALGQLYQRHYTRVAAWCLRFCDGRLEAADLAQEVFLRVHERLDSFRGDSRFSTWLYTVARSVALNRAMSAKRRQTESLDEEDAPEPVAQEPGIEAVIERSQMASALRQAMGELEPLEAKVMNLHFVHGMTLPAITAFLGLANKSGAKAYIVSGGRKLKRILRPAASSHSTPGGSRS